MKFELITFIAVVALFVCLIAALLTGCSNNTTEPFDVDDMYCTNYPEFCLPNDSTGVNEIYCGRNHTGVRCDCDIDFVGHPYAVHECNVWSL